MTKQAYDLSEVVDLEGGRDASAGMPYHKVRDLYPEVFRHGYSPEFLDEGPRPPDHVLAALADIFHEEVLAGSVRLALHPWMRRWCLWQRIRDPEHGEYWRPFQVFMRHPDGGRETPCCPATLGEDYLPPDLAQDERFWAYRGQIGDYCEPDREWIEWAERHCRRARYDTDGWGENVRAIAQNLTAQLEAWQAAVKAERERKIRDEDRDKVEYNARFLLNVAQIEEGSISNDATVNQTSLDELRARRDANEMVTVARAGFTIKAKRGTRFAEALLAEREPRQDNVAATKAVREAAHVRALAQGKQDR